VVVLGVPCKKKSQIEQTRNVFRRMGQLRSKPSAQDPQALQCFCSKKEDLSKPHARDIHAFRLELKKTKEGLNTNLLVLILQRLLQAMLKWMNIQNMTYSIGDDQRNKTTWGA